MMDEKVIYDKIYLDIYNKFENSINFDNETLKQKMLVNFRIWFEKKYKDKLLKDISEQNYVGIDYLIGKIEKITKCSDLDKNKIITIDDKFEEFKRFSNIIFKLALKKSRIDIKTYNDYKERIISYKDKINIIFEDDYEYLKSECFLDLEYLLKGKEVGIYSLRLGKYI